MFASLLTAFLFASSAIYGRKTALCFGSIEGNFYRLVLAAFFLGAITVVFYHPTLSPITFAWFFLSGLIGFGIGDVALYLAYPRIGSRLTILITFCLAPVWGAAVEYVWLETAITPLEALASAMVLLGVCLALRPHGNPHVAKSTGFALGILFGVIAGFGQGVGAVISRNAEYVALVEAVETNGISAAFQRVLGGIGVSAITFLVIVLKRGTRAGTRQFSTASRFQKTHWLLGATLMGPVIGVSCFQWALQDTPSALVLAIVATAPILVMPMSWIVEDDRPTFHGVAGAVLAVSGVVWICLIRG